MNTEQTTLLVVVCIGLVLFVGWSILRLAPKPLPFVDPVIWRERPVMVVPPDRSFSI